MMASNVIVSKKCIFDELLQNHEQVTKRSPN